MRNVFKYGLKISGLFALVFMFGCVQKDDKENSSGTTTAQGNQSPTVKPILALVADPTKSSDALLKEFNKLDSKAIRDLHISSNADLKQAPFLRKLADWPIDAHILEIFTKYLDEIGGAGNLFLNLNGGGTGINAICSHERTVADDLEARLKLLMLIYKTDNFHQGKYQKSSLAPIDYLLTCDPRFLSRLFKQLNGAEAAQVIGEHSDEELEKIVKLIVDFEDKGKNPTLRQLYQLADLDTKRRLWDKVPSWYAEIVLPGTDFSASRGMFGQPQGRP